MKILFKISCGLIDVVKLLVLFLKISVTNAPKTVQ